MNSLKVTVHQAKEEELPIVQDILMQTAGWLKSIGSKQWNGILEGKDHHDTPAAIRRGEVYLATVQGRPAGMFVLWDRQSEWDGELWGIDESQDYMYLHRVNIVREFAGQGVASKMLAASLEIAKDKGKKAVRLDCLASNDYLNKFYAGAGFAQVGVAKDHDAGEQTADFNLYEQAV
ncbi:GNAT family N-acetyltransferase [Atopococcus tabaci]|uniref:GNAT family N-acetyltransferase n=1 Tax=Atopococcus tabaci TaxID=269774 RepID=UPI00240A4011|nr:GNAT family N-acetyltransferase [Atopococcus tabaci]